VVVLRKEKIKIKEITTAGANLINFDLFASSTKTYHNV
jgi:hypothetical protein